MYRAICIRPNGGRFYRKRVKTLSELAKLLTEDFDSVFAYERVGGLPLTGRERIILWKKCFAISIKRYVDENESNV